MLKFDYQKIRVMPLSVRFFTLVLDGWIVGSAAEYMLEGASFTPKDWDIIIPSDQWCSACRAIPYQTPSNTFAGFKLRDGEHLVDVWADDVASFLMTRTTKKTGVIVQPHKQLVLSIT